MHKAHTNYAITVNWQILKLSLGPFKKGLAVQLCKIQPAESLQHQLLQGQPQFQRVSWPKVILFQERVSIKSTENSRVNLIFNYNASSLLSGGSGEVVFFIFIHSKTNFLQSWLKLCWVCITARLLLLLSPTHSPSFLGC